MQVITVSKWAGRLVPPKVHSHAARRLEALPGTRQASWARPGRVLASQEEHEQVLATERRHRMVADTSDEEGYLPSDADSDIPMNQRLSSRDLYRQMKHLPPEYPPEPEQDSPEKHMSVSDLASDEDDMLPDDPLDMDEEMIIDTKPFIADVYNQMPGVLRKATTSDIARHRSAARHESTNRPSGGASRMSTGEGEPEGRERRMMEAEEEVTEMKPASGTEGGPSADEPAGEVKSGQEQPGDPGREDRLKAAEEQKEGQSEDAADKPGSSQYSG